MHIKGDIVAGEFYLNTDGSLIIDESGNAVPCDDCPCGATDPCSLKIVNVTMDISGVEQFSCSGTIYWENYNNANTLYTLEKCNFTGNHLLCHGRHWGYGRPRELTMGPVRFVSDDSIRRHCSYPIVRARIAYSAFSRQLFITECGFWAATHASSLSATCSNLNDINICVSSTPTDFADVVDGTFTPAVGTYSYDLGSVNECAFNPETNSNIGKTISCTLEFTVEAV